MKLRSYLPLLSLVIILIGLTLPGCDELVTETINTTVIDSGLGVGCFECHTDDKNLFLRPKGQWANSAHASADLIDIAANDSDPSCVSCHTHEGYINEFDNAGFTANSYSVIGCFTCHAPHNEDFVAWDDSLLNALRGNDTTGLTVLKNGQVYFQFKGDKSILCVNCHQAQFDPSRPTSSSTASLKLPESWGPHYSGQADVIMGSGGYRFTAQPVDTTHLDPTVARGGGCLSCHYGQGSGYKFGEHTFRLHDETDNSQYVDNCNVSGCHANSNKVDLYSDSITQVIMANADTLNQFLTAQNVWDSTGIKHKTDYDFSPNQARALYNYLLYKSDGSQGVHNPAFMNQLLKESIDYLPVMANLVLDVNSAEACTASVVTARDSSVGRIDSVIVIFGDDTVYTGAPDSVYTHTFDTAGVFDLKLEAYGVIATNFNSVVLSNAVTVFDSIPVPKFGVDSIDLMERAFLDSSLFATGWQWDFGDPNSTDDTSSAQLPPNWIYSDTGTFTATLTASNPCGDSTITMPVVVDTTGTP
ncbi:MAG: PKD domain-containing protein [bacterium]|nr:PKD domain-containing protein [bacterium]